MNGQQFAMKKTFYSEDFKAEPYWWDESPLLQHPTVELPATTDVLVVGSGYTGLHCAIQTAAAGRQTLVIDSAAIGWGCSSRNGGQISGEIKPSLEQLQQKYGDERGLAMKQEARNALAWIGDFVETEALDCDYRECGRFVAAHNPSQFEQLAIEAENQTKELQHSVRIVPPNLQASELDSPRYHGGVVIDSHCSLDPAKYHAGLLNMAHQQGVDFINHCRAERVQKTAKGFKVTTSSGAIEAKEVVMATNGYTGKSAPWQQSRIIPIGSYMLTTEAMDPERLRTLMPNDRVFSDTRKIVVYFRQSPDGRRLIFGGRVSVFESDPIKCLSALRDEMLTVFPQLADVKISHSWMGFVGYTFDHLPHLGQQDGVHYAMGYCGSGICLSSYLGHRLGQQILGKEEGATAFDQTRFQTRPFYRGKPWFLAAAVRYYQLRDRLS